MIDWYEGFQEWSQQESIADLWSEATSIIMPVLKKAYRAGWEDRETLYNDEETNDDRPKGLV